jgi:hypothetical protein
MIDMAARSKKHKKHQVAECVYCGRIGPTTEEHVFPRGLFGENKRPSDPVIVPACGHCNGLKAGDDSYVRDMACLDIASDGHPIAMENRRGPIARSARKNHSQLAKEAQIHARYTPFFTDGGIYLGQAISVPVNIKRLRRWGEFVARGLYWIQENKRIPNDYVFGVNRIENSRRQSAFDDLKRFGAPGPFRMGRDDEGTEQVISWTYLVDRNNPFRAIWLVWFYQRIFISISSNPSDVEHIKHGANEQRL